MGGRFKGLNETRGEWEGKEERGKREKEIKKKKKVREILCNFFFLNKNKKKKN